MWLYPESSVDGRGPRVGGPADMGVECAPARHGSGGRRGGVCGWRLQGHRGPTAQPIPEAEERGRDAASMRHQTAPVSHRIEPDPPTNLTSADCRLSGS